MNSNINYWWVELSDNESETYSDYEDFDDSLFSSFAVRQAANADHSRISSQFSFSFSNITFRAYFLPWQPSTKLHNLKNRFDKKILIFFAHSKIIVFLKDLHILPPVSV